MVRNKYITYMEQQRMFSAAAYRWCQAYRWYQAVPCLRRWYTTWKSCLPLVVRYSPILKYPIRDIDIDIQIDKLITTYIILTTLVNILRWMEKILPGIEDPKRRIPFAWVEMFLYDLYVVIIDRGNVNTSLLQW